MSAQGTSKETARGTITYDVCITTIKLIIINCESTFSYYYYPAQHCGTEEYHGCGAAFVACAAVCIVSFAIFCAGCLGGTGSVCWECWNQNRPDQ